jgi:hypothetical protein
MRTGTSIISIFISSHEEDGMGKNKELAKN